MVSDWQAEFRERLSSTHNLLGLTTAHRERNRRSHLAHPFSWAYRARRGLPLPSGPLLAVAFPILPYPVLYAHCTRLPPSSYRRRRHTTFPSCHLLAVAYKRRPSPHQHLTPSTFPCSLRPRRLPLSIYPLPAPGAPSPVSSPSHARGDPPVFACSITTSHSPSLAVLYEGQPLARSTLPLPLPSLPPSLPSPRPSRPLPAVACKARGNPILFAILCEAWPTHSPRHEADGDDASRTASSR